MMRYAIASLVLLAILSPLRGQTAEEKAVSIRYVQALQGADGGFLATASASSESSSSKSSLRSTAAALRALKYFGGKPRDLKAAQAFARSCFDKASGGFADAPGGKANATTTAVGLMAIVELQMPREPYVTSTVKYLDLHARSFEEIRMSAAALEAVQQPSPAADKWLKEVAILRKADGTYGDGTARDTGAAAVVVLRLGGKLDQRDSILQTLRAGQSEDGGFRRSAARGADLDTTYCVMRCFWMLKEKPAHVAKLREFLAKCRNADGGYGIMPGQPSAAGPTYFAAITLHWLEELEKP
jgi:prenyltransferase beta subunit